MSDRFLRSGCSIAALVLSMGSGTAWAQDELFVGNEGATSSITVYARTANGNVAPTRTLSGAATLLNNPAGLAVDRVNNELIVANFGNNSVTVYPLTANGDVAPLRTLSGGATLLSSPAGLAVDTVNNELVVADSNMGSLSISVYARTASGNVPPLRRIAGAATGLNGPVDVALDLVNNELVVADLPAAVRVFARTANGNVAPLRVLSGGATGLNL